MVAVAKVAVVEMTVAVVVTILSSSSLIIIV